MNWIRKGQDAGLAELEAKAVSVGTNTDGGYAVPVEQDREILRLLREESPMRQACRVVTIGIEDYTKLVQHGKTASGWVGEKAARPETGTPTWSTIKPVFGEIYANPAVTQKALDDLFFNVESELAMDVAIEFAEQEGVAFLTGDGTDKPKGLLAYAETKQVAKAVRTAMTTENSIWGAQLVMDQDLYDETTKDFRVSMEYEIWFLENA